MKPHEVYDLTNKLMLDLPPGVEPSDLITIGASFIARGKFIEATKQKEMRHWMLQAIQTVIAEEAKL